MKTQAWGWLAAGVLAAGLNATYHSGGFALAHCIAGNIGHSVCAVMALATGHAEQFVAEAQSMVARDETNSARLATTLSRVPTQIARVNTDFARLEAASAREEAQIARLEASRARIEARVQERLDRVRNRPASFNFAMAPVARISRCSQIRIDVPHVDLPRIDLSRVQSMRVPMAPVVRVDLSGAGPL